MMINNKTTDDKNRLYSASLYIENKMVKWYRKPGHKWDISFNPANGIAIMVNIKTNREWHIPCYEFVMYTANYNDEVERFPGYVHKAVWSMQDFSRMIKMNRETYPDDYKAMCGE